MKRLLLVLLVACRRDRAAPPVPDASTATVTASAVVIDAAPPKKPITAAERKAYWQGITEGRKATLAKKYPDAITAFSKALAAIPDDGRALGERGYARLQAGDLTAAQADLEHALLTIPSTDPNLLAQIEFNLGLVEEQRGFKGNAAARKAAGVHFLRSYQLHATEPARDRLPGDCPVAVFKPTISTYASVAEAKTKMKEEYGFDVDGPRSVDGSSAELYEVNARGKVLLPIDGGRLARVDVGMTGTWDCGTFGDVEVTNVSGVYKVVYQAHRPGRVMGICACEDGEACDIAGSTYTVGKKCACADPMCPLVCGDTSKPEGWHIESWIDAKTGEGLFQIELDHDQLATLKLDADVAKRKFEVKSAKCTP